ncbi:MAG: MerR family transcriptional regulator [Armatimonadota bacterium]
MRKQEHEPVYVVSVAARLAGLPGWVLRVLDHEGIVVPVRTDSNRRLYSDHDIAVLARVQYLMKERKVNIEGVKVILEMERERDEANRGDTTPAVSVTTSALPPFPATTVNSH